ncbi:MAG TPA: PEGA domain-containing protein [Minicystis sp.]|jgi:hypothetical protein|nr:PEGA domain-containing protein [Minicystis sp.]
MRMTFVALATVYLSGCASVIRGTHADVPINARPSKAEVWVDGVQQGQTPLKVSMEVNSAHTVVVRAPGYKDQTIRTDRYVSGGYVALDILLGLLPAIVDAATGAWYAIGPTPINVMLTPEGGSAPVATATAAPQSQPTPAVSAEAAK